MEKRLELTEVERIDGYGIVVAFSDGTFAKYTVEQLANMNPNRSTSRALVRGGAILSNAFDALRNDF